MEHRTEQVSGDPQNGLMWALEGRSDVVGREEERRGRKRGRKRGKR